MIGNAVRCNTTTDSIEVVSCPFFRFAINSLRFFPDRKMVVIADTMVDREFGTGCVKITPAHDHNDFKAGR